MAGGKVMTPQQVERRKRQLIAEYSAIHAIHPGSLTTPDPTLVYHRQLVAFHVGLFHGLVSLAKTDDDFRQVEEELNTIKGLLPYYDTRPAVSV